jgi:myo-inositol 2-dehydrogenase/D-chiro-inositol 1-dehydrogenase
MTERRIAFGVIGTGAIGRLHGQHLASRVPGASLAAIADIDRAAAERFAGQVGSPAVYTDYRDLLSDRMIEAVVISSPPETHAQVIEEAAAAGKQIFCEKPFDCELERIDRALAAVAGAGVRLQIGFNRRFDANYRSVHQAIASGKIGRPLILHLISRDPQLDTPSSNQANVGMLLDMTIHDFDMARYLIGSEVASVYTLAASTFDPAHEQLDTAVITLQFANGAFGTIDNSMTAYGYDQRLEVFGTEGAISIGNETLHRATVTDESGRHAALPLFFFAERYGESYIAELAAFVRCVIDGTETAVTGADGRIAVEIALAAQRSLDEGRPVTVGAEA